MAVSKIEPFGSSEKPSLILSIANPFEHKILGLGEGDHIGVNFSVKDCKNTDIFKFFYRVLFAAEIPPAPRLLELDPSDQGLRS